MPVRARRGHQLSNAVDQLQWGENQFTRVFVGLQRLCVPFAAAVEQISTTLFEPVHGEWWARTVTQQSLQPCAVRCIDTHPGIDGKSTPVGVSSHVFGITCLNVAACHKGAQQAFAYVGLHLGNGGLVKSRRLVKPDARRIGQGCRAGELTGPGIWSAALAFTP